jgi:hypothetical protein
LVGFDERSYFGRLLGGRHDLIGRFAVGFIEAVDVGSSHAGGIASIVSLASRSRCQA